MEYRVLGRTGVSVSAYALGTMMFGRWGNPDAAECTQMVHRALEAGINLLDTADIYDDGRSEEILGTALAGCRDDVVVATKFGNPMGEGLNTRGGARRWVVRACEDSLRRLRTDWIDLYQVHRLDETAAIDETLSALDDLVHQGKVRYVGTSTFPPSALVEAQWAAQSRHLARPVAEQPPYSVLARGVEAEVLPVCQRYDVGVLVWAPLNGGWLTGKYRSGAAPASRADREPAHFDYDSHYRAAKAAAVEALATVASDAGLRLVDLAHAFVLAHPAVTSAIIGPRTLAQLDDVLPGAGVRLDDGVLDAIDAIVAPGTNLNPADAGWSPPWLSAGARRRVHRN
ncbi:MAG TPA: aldo/keto reductase [Acidimicrobiales bacterium]|nr:aldo/keto reductase [Acidimicrobiales bacterium]